MDLFEVIFNTLGGDRGELEQENVEYIKNGIKTTVTLFFDKKGILVNVSTKSEYVKSPEEEKLDKIEALNQQITEAVEREDFELASHLKRERDALENQQ